MNHHIERCGETGCWGKSGRGPAKRYLAQIAGATRVVSASPSQPQNIPAHFAVEKTVAIKVVYVDRPKATIEQLVAVDALQRQRDLRGLDRRSHSLHPFASGEALYYRRRR